MSLQTPAIDEMKRQQLVQVKEDLLEAYAIANYLATMNFNQQCWENQSQDVQEKSKHVCDKLSAAYALLQQL